MEHQPDAKIIPLRNQQEPQLRLPPHNYEAEQALLGALLANNSVVYAKVAGLVRAEDFGTHCTVASSRLPAG